MENLPDPRDIDMVLCRGREKFDLGFTCDCQRGWCALMNNPEGIQNPRVSTAPLSAGLADGCDRRVRSPHSTCFYSSFAAQLYHIKHTRTVVEPGEAGERGRAKVEHAGH